MKNILTILIALSFLTFGCMDNSSESQADGLNSSVSENATDSEDELLPLQKVIAKTDTKIKEENKQITETIKEKVGTSSSNSNEVKQVNYNSEKLVNQCPPDIICTQVFKSQYLIIEDQNNKPVILDSYNIYYGGSIIGVKKMTDTKTGKYTLIDDNAVKIIPQKDAKITFKGFIKNKEVVNYSVKVSHDCCHITSVDGNQSIVVKL